MSRATLTEPDPGIEPLLDDVDEGLIDRDLDLDLGIGGHQPRDLRIKDRLRRPPVRGDADATRRPRPQRGEAREPRLDLVERGPERGGKLLARLGRRDRPRRPGQQPQIEPLLQPLDRVAQRRLRGVEPGGGAGEAALLADREKGHEIGELVALH